MKFIIVFAATLISATAANAQYGNNLGYGSGGYGTGSNSNSHTVDGHFRSNGTYVEPHRATNPNSTQMDNYSTRGNYNPNTGSFGTRSPRY